MRYGIPYLGSKNKICDKLAEAIPAAKNFYDVFAGGCAMTHKILLRGDFENYFANDLDGAGLRLFIDAAAGKLETRAKEWVSREDFYRLKDTDPFVSIFWSFGNNRREYLFSREREPWKKALHYARIHGDCSFFEAFGIRTDGSTKDITKHAEEYKRKYVRWWLKQNGFPLPDCELDVLIERGKASIAAEKEELRQYLLSGLASSGMTKAEVERRLGNKMAGHYFGKSQWAFPTGEQYRRMQEFIPALDRDYAEIRTPKALQRLQSLERLQRLQSLESLQSLHPSFASYDEVEILPDSVIYCDPPYAGVKGSNDYKASVDHEKFYDWCERQNELVLISEYAMPADRFTEVYRVDHVCRLSSSGNFHVFERLFVPTRQVALYKSRMEASTNQLLLF